MAPELPPSRYVLEISAARAAASFRDRPCSFASSAARSSAGRSGGIIIWLHAHVIPASRGAREPESRDGKNEIPVSEWEPLLRRPPAMLLWRHPHILFPLLLAFVAVRRCTGRSISRTILLVQTSGQGAHRDL